MISLPRTWDLNDEGQLKRPTGFIFAQVVSNALSTSFDNVDVVEVPAVDDVDELDEEDEGGEDRASNGPNKRVALMKYTPLAAKSTFFTVPKWIQTSKSISARYAIVSGNSV